jgi:hypothetical protein
MSTKTTFKRVALVAVASMGFGVLTSVTPASAADSGFSVGYTSLTVVANASVGTNYAFLPVNVTNSDGAPAALQSTESITATVTAWPTAVDSTTASTDLTLTVFKRDTASNNVFAAVSTGTTVGSGAGAARVGSSSAASVASITDSGTAEAGTYWFGIKPASSSKAVDKGTYTVRFRYTAESGFITSVNVPVTFVSSAADSGAAITIATVGSFTSGETTTMSATKSVTATLTNGTAGGRVQEATSATAIGIPTLVAATWAGTTAAIVDPTTEWSVLDDGSQVTSGLAGEFYSATASDSKTAWSQAANGVYGIVASGTGTLGVTELSVSPYLRVTYGSTAATKALTIVNAVSGASTGIVFSATGQLASSCATACNLPLTTKSASWTVTGGTAGKSYSYSVAWTLAAAADTTPLTATPTTVYADSLGTITVPIALASPIDGSTATVTITGYTSNPAVQIVNWKKSAATTISVDNGGAYVALKSTNVWTATITDAFGAGVAGVVLQPALSSTSSNYSATAVIPTITTGADGKATYSLTDAAAVAAGFDKVTFTAVAGTTLAGTNNSTITYAATAPQATTIAAYTGLFASSADTALVTPVPSTGLDDSSMLVATARNNSLAITASGTNEYKFRVSTGVVGAKVTAAGSAGVYFVGSTNFISANASTKFTGTTGYTSSWIVGSTKTGTNTVTFTQGTVSTSITFQVYANASGADARTVKVSQAAAAGPVTISVTDRFGNGVSSENVQVGVSAGTLGNGQMTTVYSTDLDGNIKVLPSGADSAVVTATLSNPRDTGSAAGYMGTTVIDPTVAAGIRTATATITPASTTGAQDQAQAATDAAAEATDAANAATDAANAAAEAADAATAAAQDAADAVAALSAQVSSLISGLKAQLTALTNLVIKIQKKVKA